MNTRTMSGLAAVREAASIIREGGIAAIPTETVYGLAADALNAKACAQIFEAKGRPADNPLIVHVAQRQQAAFAWDTVTERAALLMEAFWPGPLSIVLPKNARIPDVVSAGLPTVAVRMPDSAITRDIIMRAGVPLAAPSANRSGRPSPTDAKQVAQDMNGRIPLIVDAGPCSVGVESTVVDLTGEDAVILRPGGISEEEISHVIGSVRAHHGRTDDRPASPGMKYVHYAPKARVAVFGPYGGPIAKSIRTLYDTHKEKGGRPCVLCLEADSGSYGGLDTVVLGKGRKDAERALFRELRSADERGNDLVLFHASADMGSAVLDRIMRAAGRPH